MKFYAYKGNYELGKEPLGTFDKMMFELKTTKGALRRCYQCFKTDFRLYYYSNFYDNKTFKEVKR